MEGMSLPINRMKQNFSHEEFVRICSLIAKRFRG